MNGTKKVPEIRKRISELGLSPGVESELVSELQQTPTTKKDMKKKNTDTPAIGKVVSALKEKPVTKIIDQMKQELDLKKLAQKNKNANASVSQFRVKDKVQKMESLPSRPPRIAKPRMTLKEPVFNPKPLVVSESLGMTPSRNAALKAKKASKAKLTKNYVEPVEMKKDKNPIEKTQNEVISRSSPRLQSKSSLMLEDENIQVKNVETPRKNGSSKTLVTPSPAKPVIGKRKRPTDGPFTPILSNNTPLVEVSTGKGKRVKKAHDSPQSSQKTLKNSEQVEVVEEAEQIENEEEEEEEFHNENEGG